VLALPSDGELPPDLFSSGFARLPLEVDRPGAVVVEY
jgi:hypothetical protein